MDPPVMDDVFSFELVFVEAGGTVFTLIKDWLMVEGSPFVDMFSLPPTENTESPVEGRSKTNPIVLEQTSAQDFRAFLSTFYPQGHKVTTYTEWLGVLRLATRWNFTKVREQAIRALQVKPELTPATKIHLAREFAVRHWLRDGLVDLVLLIIKDNIEPDALLSAPHNIDAATAANVFFICYMVKPAVAAPRAGEDDSCVTLYCKKCRRTTQHTPSLAAYNSGLWGVHPEPGMPVAADTVRVVQTDIGPDRVAVESLVDRVFKAEMARY